MIFSILIPSIFERLDRLQKLSTELQRQIDAFGCTKRVEIVSVVDNCRVSIGTKRQMVLDASHGQYVAFCDDDDWIEPDYIPEIMTAIFHHPGVDVITFDQRSYIEDHDPIIINFKHGNPNESVHFDSVPTKRAAWHMNVWRRGLAVQSKFPDNSYGEDWLWAKPLNEMVKHAHHIDKVLHVYTFKKTVSRAAN